MGSEVSGRGVIENPFGSNREASSGDDYPLNFSSVRSIFFVSLCVLSARFSTGSEGVIKFNL